MSRQTPPLSFNTVKRSNRPQRIQRLRRERMIMLALFAVFCAIVLTLIVFLVCSTADLISDRHQSDTEDTTDQNDPPFSSGLILESITKASEDVHTGTLVLVNSSNAYVFPSANTHLINLRDHREKVNGSNTYQVSYDNMLLQKEACAALNRMMIRYFELSEDGSTLVTSAYRTFQDQEDLHSSVKAGYSDHHTGYCISLKKFVTSNISSLESDHWIYENAHKYGFIVRYPDEKADVTGVSDYTHCFRFVGIPHAYYMFENRYCMEEYVDLLKNHYTPEKPLQITADGKPYQVYYLAASASELTTLQVPANYAYTLSGDNVGGFIVTVDLSSPK